jgi:hypothetical protein
VFFGLGEVRTPPPKKLATKCCVPAETLFDSPAPAPSTFAGSHPLFFTGNPDSFSKDAFVERVFSCKQS